jgi:hypothetical protein
LPQPSRYAQFLIDAEAAFAEIKVRSAERMELRHNPVAVMDFAANHDGTRRAFKLNSGSISS